MENVQQPFCEKYTIQERNLDNKKIQDNQIIFVDIFEQFNDNTTPGSSDLPELHATGLAPQQVHGPGGGVRVGGHEAAQLQPRHGAGPGHVQQPALRMRGEVRAGEARLGLLPVW